ncbi:MAG TPA: hypothetical protein DCW68_05615 [Rhodospirillaceae bacterium]|nr:MAG: hypothetical protein A2018_02040 [Alphaproteobacteria bacterium GWF2_58_20]HAU29571.1 hypothetical protein [Rhodospirillaceae bacterium]
MNNEGHSSALSREAKQAIMDALTYRNASPAMAAAMLRRVFLLSVSAQKLEDRREMSKCAISLAKVYPQALSGPLIAEGFRCWKQGGMVEGNEFCLRVGNLLEEPDLSQGQARDVFSAVFDAACASGSMLALGKVLKSHILRFPEVLRGNPLLPHFAAMEDIGWGDLHRASYVLLHSRNLIGFCSDLACPEMRDYALSGMGDDRIRITREASLLATALAKASPDLFEPVHVARMIKGVRQSPLAEKEKGVLEILMAVLPGHPERFVLPVENFLVEHLFAMPPEHDTPRKAQHLLRKCLRAEPELVAPLLGRMGSILKKGQMVSWQTRMSAVKAMEVCADVNPQLRDENLLETLVEAGCRDANMNVRDAARETLVKLVKDFDGSRKRLFKAALLSTAHPLSNEEAESGRRVMVLLMENRLDDSENQGFTMVWEGIKNLTRLGDAGNQEFLAKMLVNMIDYTPSCANPLFVQELYDLRCREQNPLGKMHLTRIFEKTLEKRPDLGPALCKRKPGCKPQ